MKERKLNWLMPLFKGIAFVVLGIIIINQPDESMKVIIKTLGIALVFIGAGISTFSWYTRNNLNGYKNYLIMGIVLLAIGMVLIFYPESSGRIIAIGFALVIGFSGIVNLIISSNLKKWGAPRWFWIFIVSILELLIAIVFILNPKIAGLTFITVLSVGMIIFGLLNILISVNLKRSINYFNQLTLEEKA